MNFVVSLISSSHDKIKSINSEIIELFRDMQSCISEQVFTDLLLISLIKFRLIPVKTSRQEREA